MDLERLIHEFVEHIDVERNLSPRTVEAYQRDLRKWVSYLNEDAVPLDTDAVGVEQVRGFMRWLSNGGRAPATVRRALWCLKSLYTFGCRFKGVERNPSMAIVPPRMPERLPDVPSRSEVMRLLRACDENYFRLYRVRDKAIIATLAFLGVRRQELIDLHLDDWNAEQQTVLIRSGKGRRDRMLPVPGDLAALVEAWLDARPDADVPNLFISRCGGPLRASALYRMLKRLIRKAGLERNVGLHSLRHYAATSLVQSPNGGLAHAQRLLGHQSPQSTAVYVHLSVDDLRQGVSESLGLAERPPSRNHAHALNLDAATEHSAKQLTASLSALPNGWQRDSPTVRWMVTEWTRQSVPSRDSTAFRAGDVDEILWSRATVPSLALDDHLRIAAFGRCVWGRMTASDPAALQVSDVIGIGSDLSQGLPGGGPVGEPLSAKDLTAFDQSVTETQGSDDPLPVLADAISIYAHLQTHRLGIPSGRSTIEVWTGLWLWHRGLPALVVAAAERPLWHLVVERYCTGDRLPALSYAIARTKTIVDEVMQRSSGESEDRL